MLGKILITISNLFYSIGALAFDYNETHVMNPRWPPHAKFHNGQTMTLGLLLSTASLYFLYRPSSHPKDDLRTSALIGSFYCIAGLSAILYPGTAWNDPEYPPAPQGYMFAGTVVAIAVGYWLEAAGLEGKGKGKKVKV